MYEYLNLLREQVVCPGKNQRNNSGGCLHPPDKFKLISDGSDCVCSSTNLAIVRLILMALKKDYINMEGNEHGKHQSNRNGSEKRLTRDSQGE